MEIAIVGLGYVGAANSLLLAQKNNVVVLAAFLPDQRDGQVERGRSAGTMAAVVRPSRAPGGRPSYQD